MTFTEIKTAVIALADDPAITDTQAGIWVNANYRLLLRERDWPFMVGNGIKTVTSGTQEYAFSGFTSSISNFAKPLRVWIANSSTSDKTPLTPINYEDRNIAGLTNSYYITPDNLSIGLVPAPTNSTNVITLDYLKTTTDLDDTTTTPVFVSDFHYILVWKALMNYQFQQREASDEFRAQYNEILASMVRFYFSPEAGRGAMLSRGVGRTAVSGTSNPLGRL